MKNQKNIKETLSPEAMQEVEKMIDSAEDDKVKCLMKQLLSFTHEELGFLIQEMERRKMTDDEK